MSKKLVFALLATLPLATSAHAKGGLIDKTAAGARVAKAVMTMKGAPLKERLQAVGQIAVGIADPRLKLRFDSVVYRDGAAFFGAERQLPGQVVEGRSVMLFKDRTEMYIAHGKAQRTDGTDTSHFDNELRVTQHETRVNVGPKSTLVQTQAQSLSGRPAHGTAQMVIDGKRLDLTPTADINAEDSPSKY